MPRNGRTWAGHGHRRPPPAEGATPLAFACGPLAVSSVPPPFPITSATSSTTTLALPPSSLHAPATLCISPLERTGPPLALQQSLLLSPLHPLRHEFHWMQGSTAWSVEEEDGQQAAARRPRPVASIVSSPLTARDFSLQHGAFNAGEILSISFFMSSVLSSPLFLFIICCQWFAYGFSYNSCTSNYQQVTITSNFCTILFLQS